MIGYKRNKKAQRERARLRKLGWKPSSPRTLKQRLKVVRLTKIESAWLAGFVDGEGCINMKPSGRDRNLVPRVSVVNTNLGVLKYILKLTGVGIIYEMSRSSMRWKPAYTWEVSNSSALSVVIALKPYLRIKQKQARVLLRYKSTMRFNLGGPCAMRTAHQRRTRLHVELKRLNKRGVSAKKAG